MNHILKFNTKVAELQSSSIKAYKFFDDVSSLSKYWFTTKPGESLSFLKSCDYLGLNTSGTGFKLSNESDNFCITPHGKVLNIRYMDGSYKISEFGDWSEEDKKLHLLKRVEWQDIIYNIYRKSSIDEDGFEIVEDFERIINPKSLDINSKYINIVDKYFSDIDEKITILKSKSTSYKVILYRLNKEFRIDFYEHRDDYLFVHVRTLRNSTTTKSHIYKCDSEWGLKNLLNEIKKLLV